MVFAHLMVSCIPPLWHKVLCHVSFFYELRKHYLLRTSLDWFDSFHCHFKLFLLSRHCFTPACKSLLGISQVCEAAQGPGFRTNELGWLVGVCDCVCIAAWVKPEPPRSLLGKFAWLNSRLNIKRKEPASWVHILWVAWYHCVKTQVLWCEF